MIHRRDRRSNHRSRRLATSRRADRTFVSSTMDRAARSRTLIDNTIIHTDHQQQFTAWAFTPNLRCYGLRLSTGTVGDCYYNPLVMSLSRRKQAGRFNIKAWTTVEEPSTAIAECIENFQNMRRRPPGYAHPAAFQTRSASQLQSFVIPDQKQVSNRAERGIGACHCPSGCEIRLEIVMRLPNPFRGIELDDDWSRINAVLAATHEPYNVLPASDNW